MHWLLARRVGTHGKRDTQYTKKTIHISNRGQDNILLHVVLTSIYYVNRPWEQGSWGQHGAHLGPVSPRWAPCWPRGLCYLGTFLQDLMESRSFWNHHIGEASQWQSCRVAVEFHGGRITQNPWLCEFGRCCGMTSCLLVDRTENSGI